MNKQRAGPRRQHLDPYGSKDPTSLTAKNDGTLMNKLNEQMNSQLSSNMVALITIKLAWDGKRQGGEEKKNESAIHQTENKQSNSLICVARSHKNVQMRQVAPSTATKSPQ